MQLNAGFHRSPALGHAAGASGKRHARCDPEREPAVVFRTGKRRGDDPDDSGSRHGRFSLVLLRIIGTILDIATSNLVSSIDDEENSQSRDLYTNILGCASHR